MESSAFSECGDCGFPQAVYDARFHAAFLGALGALKQSEPKSKRAIALKLFLGQVWSGGMKIYSIALVTEVHCVVNRGVSQKASQFISFVFASSHQRSPYDASSKACNFRCAECAMLIARSYHHAYCILN